MATDPRMRRALAVLGAAAVVVGLAVVFARSGGAEHPPVAPSPSASVAGPVAAAAPDAHTAPAAPAPDRAAHRKMLLDSVQLADQTYCSYRHASKYPHDSRPIAEHPDRIWPNAPVLESNAMREAGGATNPEVLIQTAQSRVYLAAGESVTLALRAVDAANKPLPLVVTGASAQGLLAKGARPGPQVALPFADDGALADRVAGDGQFSATLEPAGTALAQFHGTIRTLVRYNAAGKSGAVAFDIVYSPQVPAAWTGQVREAMEDGSLNFYLKLDVREAGRYLVSGRVDDARGTPLALLTFNDVLPAGPGEVKLSLFGKLARDHGPAMPLTLRDVEGYLLRENTDPDRMMMPRLPGKVHRSRAHPLKNFAEAEWQGAERARYLEELGRDMNRARANFAQFEPAVVLPPPCAAD